VEKHGRSLNQFSTDIDELEVAHSLSRFPTSLHDAMSERKYEVTSSAVEPTPFAHLLALSRLSGAFLSTMSQMPHPQSSDQ